MVLFPENLKISKSMKQLLKREAFKVTFDRAFPEILEECATVKRDGTGLAATGKKQSRVMY